MQLYTTLFAFSAIFQGICASAHDASMKSPAHTIAELTEMIQSQRCFTMSNMPRCLQLLIQHGCSLDMDIPHISQYQFAPIPAMDPNTLILKYNIPDVIESEKKWFHILGYINRMVVPTTQSTFFTDLYPYQHMQHEEQSGYMKLIHRATYACPEPFTSQVKHIAFEVHGEMWVNLNDWKYHSATTAATRSKRRFSI